MANKSTWVKIDRNLTKWRWFKNPNTLTVWMWLILEANIEDHEFCKEIIRRGEIATSYNTIAAETGLTIKQVRTALGHLKSTGEVAVRYGANYQVISVINYDLYQASGADLRADKGQGEGRVRAGKGQQSKNIRTKEVKNEKNLCIAPSAKTHEKTPSATEVAAYFAARGRSQQDADKFFSYNQAKDWRIGRTRIADWQSLADMWIAGDADVKPPPGYDPHPELDDFGRPIKPEYQ